MFVYSAPAWLAASIKFLIPFSVLVRIGSQVGWQAPRLAARPGVASFMQEIGQAFVQPVAHKAFVTCATVLLRWGFRWRRIQRLAGAKRPIALLSCDDRLEPGIFGIFRPVLLWPSGISDRLADAQLEAIIAHGFCHVHRRDNLAAAVHMVVEAIFWFHPLVRWLGARLVDEGENACIRIPCSLESGASQQANSRRTARSRRRKPGK